jgi:hypothetical protein
LTILSISLGVMGYLDGVEFLVNDVDHPLDLLGSDGSGAGLLTQQVHHVGCELLAALQQQQNNSTRGSEYDA